MWHSHQLCHLTDSLTGTSASCWAFAAFSPALPRADVPWHGFLLQGESGKFPKPVQQALGLRLLFIVWQLGQCHPSTPAPLALPKLKPIRLNPAQHTAASELPKSSTHSFSVSNCCYIWKTVSREDGAFQGRERKQILCLHSAGQHCSPKLPWLGLTRPKFNLLKS